MIIEITIQYKTLQLVLCHVTADFWKQILDRSIGVYVLTKWKRVHSKNKQTNNTF